jgi:putative flippase GtrA
VKKLQNLLKNSQKLKFVLIGGFNTALDFIILFGLKFFGLPELVANGFSTGTTFIISFILNKKITFKSTGKTRQQLAHEMILFTVVTLFGLWVIQTFIIWVLKPIFLPILSENLALFLAKIIATIFSMIWNFILYKKVVFKQSQTA